MLGGRSAGLPTPPLGSGREPLDPRASLTLADYAQNPYRISPDAALLRITFQVLAFIAMPSSVPSSM
jgi:hypothetical protein